jgi:phosphomannomutase
MPPCSTARAWLAQDPDEVTRAELAALIAAAEGGDAAASADLDDRFGTRLAFGTAGLRGRLGAGSNRMNRVLVSQAAAGFAAYLREKAAPGRRRRSSSATTAGGTRTCSRRTRRRSSRARACAQCCCRDAPDPVLAFAVRHLAPRRASW